MSQANAAIVNAPLEILSIIPTLQKACQSHAKIDRQIHLCVCSSAYYAVEQALAEGKGNARNLTLLISTLERYNEKMAHQVQNFLVYSFPFTRRDKTTTEIDGTKVEIKYAVKYSESKAKSSLFSGQSPRDMFDIAMASNFASHKPPAAAIALEKAAHPNKALTQAQLDLRFEKLLSSYKDIGATPPIAKNLPTSINDILTQVKRLVASPHISQKDSQVLNLILEIVEDVMNPLDDIMAKNTAMAEALQSAQESAKDADIPTAPSVDDLANMTDEEREACTLLFGTAA